MTHTIDIAKLNSHREMLLDSYRSELNRMQSRLEEAQQRLELGLHPEGRGNWQPTHHHDAYNMAAVCQELQRIASQIDMVDTVLRSLTAA